MFKNRGSIVGASLLYRSGSKLKPTPNGYCHITETPDLPVWVNSPKNTKPKAQEEEEDFVLPSRLDSLGGDWRSRTRRRSSFYDNGSKLVFQHPKIDDADMIAEVFAKKRGTFTSPEDVVRCLDDEYSSMNMNINKDLVDKILNKTNNDWISAFGFFNWVDSQTNYTHSSDSYNIMVDILGKAKRFDFMWVLVKEMVQVRGEGSLVSLTTMAKVTRRLAGAGRWVDAIESFRMIEEFGVKKDTSSMNMLLDALCKENGVRRAWGVFMEYRDEITPDAASFNILIHGWCNAGQLEEARSTMDEMQRFGFNPCVISYTSLIEAYCKLKDFREVDFILDEMQTRGCPPNVVTYTIVMHALGKAKETQEAFLVYDQMKKNNCVPDTGFFNSLIYILGRAGRIQNAHDVLVEMKHTGISPDATTYGTLISLACDHSQDETALKLLKEMEEEESSFPCCKPDLKTFTPLLKIACKKNAVRLLNYLLNYMLKKDLSLDMGTYCLLVEEHCKNGRVEQACVFFEEMVLKRQLPKNQTYSRLILSLEKKKMKKTKGRIQQLMAMAHKTTRCQISSPKIFLSMNA